MTATVRFRYVTKDANGSFVGPMASSLRGTLTPPDASSPTGFGHGTGRFVVPAGVNTARLKCTEGSVCADWGPAVNDYSPYAGSATAYQLYAGDEIDIAVSEGNVISYGRAFD